MDSVCIPMTVDRRNGMCCISWQIERATLSGIVATLVRKGLVDQTSDSEDQRQRLLRVTCSGKKLWKELPNPMSLILAVAFESADPAELATARRVLQEEAQRLRTKIYTV